MSKILVIGACGQLGTELTQRLKESHGEQNVLPSDLKDGHGFYDGQPFVNLDVLDKENLTQIVKDHQITQIYHLAAILSAKGENDPLFAWRLNMDGLLNVLEIAREHQLDKIYWPQLDRCFWTHYPKDHDPPGYHS